MYFFRYLVKSENFLVIFREIIVVLYYNVKSLRKEERYEVTDLSGRRSSL